MVRPITFAAVGTFLLAGCATGRLAFDQGVESARPASGAQESHMPVVVLASNSGALPLVADTSSAHATAIVEEGEAMQSLSADVADIRDRRTQLERDLALLENAEAPKTAEVVTPGASLRVTAQLIDAVEQVVLWADIQEAPLQSAEDPMAAPPTRTPPATRRTR